MGGRGRGPQPQKLCSNDTRIWGAIQGRRSPRDKFAGRQNSQKRRPSAGRRF
ncbi:hypothetical protein HMPREF0262_01225 [Clostridium sp. ATCC 29733]|nr:hypothetical protein HMPREF0262_01225 [Clostridium sp. ATCC 29733]